MIIGEADERDRGLSKAVGAGGVAVAVFNTVVGAGIFVLPAALAREVGPAAPLAYLACVIAMGGVVICFAAAGSRVPTSGGPYGYAQAAFGPFVGFLVGVLVWLGAVLAAAGIAAAITDSLARLVPVLSQPIWRALFIVTLFSAMAATNIGGVASGTRLVGVLTVSKLIPLAVLLIVGGLHVKLSNFGAPGPGLAHFGRAMILTIFAFQGMEGALGVSGEVRDPARNIPRGLFTAMAVVTGLYIAIQLVAQGVLGAALSRSTSPLADVVAGVSPWLGGLLLAGASVSMLGYLASDTLSAPRVLYAFARDGLLPSRVGALQRRTRAPWVAIVLHVTLAAALAISGSFAELAVLSALATTGVYIVACIAAAVLQRREVAIAGQPFAPRALLVAAVIGVAGMVWIGLQASLQEAVGMAATLFGATVWYTIATRFTARRERN